jgi:phosphotransferase system HPr (HPr) family protein
MEKIRLTIQQEIVVRNKVGLHARPAALFVKTAGRYKSRLSVENLTSGKPPANAKSILSLLSCGVSQNNLIRITAEGSDETEALAALVGLIEKNFE